MGAERRCSITGWRTRATRAPPAFHPSRARLHPVSVARSSAARMSSSSVGSPKPVYSYPSCGRVRALHAILRPRIPPNRPQDAQNGRESGFPGFQEHDPGWLSPSRPRTHPRADPQARAGHGQVLNVGRIVGHDGATLGRGPRDGVRGLEHLAARRSRGGPKTQGQRGRSPPPASLGDSRSVAPASTLLVSHNHADSRVICMTGSRGRPGLFTTPTKACPSSILCRTSEPRAANALRFSARLLRDLWCRCTLAGWA